MKHYVTSGHELPQWPSPISHAVVANDTCYLSGQLSLDADGRYVPGTPAEEARRAFANLFRAIEAAGFSPRDLVFVDIAFSDLGALADVNGVYADLFPADRRPARTVYQAAALPFGGQVKVMGVAVRDASR
ncbi:MULTISPECIES: RidA family protein [Burkholderia]|uniref:RidA family protein n=1 Tax=Burkholderia TaxID=32008 RepID=UPI000678AFD1|nr:MULTISPECIES: RidA family protein [Burkholderia]KWU23033.1 translation initiation inhibitor [Burkholderia cenocepacia]QRR17765.1 RidA family protein [Burkholderia sp. MS389]CAG2380612.1 translation initiation inhibitor [Burkholderia cenocepacia]CAG2380784.1 translation initiation inhibitor [Burkholderia cenocepacia]CAG2380895.1 translation initiation inhibitor [Burkholderia cenocepacia]